MRRLCAALVGARLLLEVHAQSCAQDTVGWNTQPLVAGQGNNCTFYTSMKRPGLKNAV